jgi:hypothetical protein
MNQDEVQVQIDAAVAAAATNAVNQQQVAIDAAVAAAAITAADQQQIAIDAAVAAAVATAANQVAVTFALTPGVANPNDPWDYTSNEGVKQYYQAISPLSPKFKGDARALKVVLSGLTSKAQQNGWDNLIMMIPDSAGNVQNLLKHYTSLTLANVRARALTYIGTPTRACQASSQLASCILASMGEDFLINLLTRVNDYTVQGIEDGPCMLKSLISIVTVEAKSSLPLIKKMLGNLGELMKEVNSDITEFNLRVDDLMNQLRAANDDYPELLDKLFEAYQQASDKEFVRYIADKQSRWEDNELDIVPDTLKVLAGDKHKTMVLKKTWNKSTEDESNLIAMTARLTEMTAMNAELLKVKKSFATRGGQSKSFATRGGQSKERNTDDAKWAWKLVAPTGDQAKEKSFEKKDYIYCPFHNETKWVLATGHASGCKNDPNSKSTGSTDEPNKKVLQYAKALMNVMEHGGDDDDSEMQDEDL